MQSGAWSEAVESLRAAVKAQPNSPELRNVLGLALAAAGAADEAEKAYRRALQLRPGFADALNNLGRLLHSLGRSADAEQILRRALAFQPSHAYAHDSLGMLLLAAGRTEEASRYLRRAVELDARLPHAHHQRGMLFLTLGDAKAAEASLREALALDERFAPAHIGLAELQCRLGKWHEAESSYRRAIALEPALAEAYANLGSVLVELGRHEEAERACRRALELDPRSASAHCNLGLALMRLGRGEQAEASSRLAISLSRDLVPAHLNLGKILVDSGRAEEAEAVFRTVTSLDPARLLAYETIAVLQNYIPGRTQAEVDAAHRAFGARLHAPHGGAHRNSREPGRRLRIGYVSPDFREHSVASFIEPVLGAHDREAFEITCYYNHASPDASTERLKALAGRWRDIRSLDDEAVASAIAADGIDVLVDLAGCTAGHRLAVFARHPSPVQGTWLGYPTATGCPAIDFRITDPRVDEPGEEAPGIERPVRLANSYFCFAAPREEVEPGGVPMEASGSATFGCFNALLKINQPLVRLWARVLSEAPRSRLVLKARGLDSEAVRQRVLDWFRQEGIAAERIALTAQHAGKGEHLAHYRTIDVALDTFPYNGATTTCEALGMGVPVVSLSGATHASRMGRSILHAAGLGELACASEEACVRLACGLAADGARLAATRRSLRERLRRSALMDATTFTRGLEAAYREQWRRWCESA